MTGLELRDTFVYDAVRTPRGKGSPNGALASVPPNELVSQLVAALGVRNGEATLRHVQKLVLSCVGQVGAQGGHIAMVSRLSSQLSNAVTVLSLNNFCAGGLNAIGLANAMVRSHELDLVLAGGVECMSQVPFLADNASYYNDPDLSWDLHFVPVGLSADYLAFAHDVSRGALNEASYESHQRAARAWREGRYDSAVVPVRDRAGAIVLDKDETIREQLTPEAMAGLSPVFEAQGQERYDAVIRSVRPGLGEIDHRHTLANCPPIADGASLVLLGSREAGARAGLEPLARLAAFVEASGDPVDQLTSGVAAMKLLLAREKLDLDDFDLIEFMEAFAVTPARFYRDFAPDRARVNVNGGHLAMGHPMGATGAVLTTTLTHEMKARGARRGLVVATGGSGVGAAAVFEAP